MFLDMRNICTEPEGNVHQDKLFPQSFQIMPEFGCKSRQFIRRVGHQ